MLGAEAATACARRYGRARIGPIDGDVDIAAMTAGLDASSAVRLRHVDQPRLSSNRACSSYHEQFCAAASAAARNLSALARFAVKVERRKVYASDPDSRCGPGRAV